jgi:DNA-directed RNA polymerase specialized sigma24 family protein
MDLTDKEYVERCRDGHQEDFRVLVDRYQKPLFAYLAGRLRDGRQVEEAAQESFVRAFLSLKKLRTGRQGTTAFPEASPAGL